MAGTGVEITDGRASLVRAEVSSRSASCLGSASPPNSSASLMASSREPHRGASSARAPEHSPSALFSDLDRGISTGTASSLGLSTGAEAGWVGEASSCAGAGSQLGHSALSLPASLLLVGMAAQCSSTSCTGGGLLSTRGRSSGSSTDPAPSLSSSASTSSSTPSSPWPLSPSLLTSSLSDPGSKSISMKSSEGEKDRTLGLCGLVTIWSWMSAATPVDRLDCPAPATPGKLSPSLPLSSLSK